MPPLPSSLKSLIFQAIPILAALLAIWGLQDRYHYPESGIRIHSLRILPGPDSPPDLMPEDRLLEVNGIAAVRDLQARSLMAQEGLKGSLELLIEREGHEYSIQLPVEKPTLSRKAYWTLRTLAGLLVFLTGWLVIRRRGDPLAQLFLLLCVLLGDVLIPQPRALAAPWCLILELESDIFSIFLAPLFLHFIILFPESRPRSRLLLTAIYGPILIWTLLDAVGVLLLDDPTRLLYPLEKIAGLHAAFLMVIALAVLSVKTFRRTRQRERYRLRLVLLGGVLGLLPLLLFQILHQLFPAQVLSASASAPLFLVFLPISFAYGILGRDLLVLQRRAERAGRWILQGAIFFTLFMGINLLTVILTGEPDSPISAIGRSALSLLFALLVWFPLYRYLPGSRRIKNEEVPGLRRLLHGNQGFIHLDAFMEVIATPLCEDLGSSWALWLSRGEDGWIERSRYQHPDAEIRLPARKSGAKPMSMPGRLEKRLLNDRVLLAAELWDPYWSRSLLGSKAQEFCQGRGWSLILSFPLDREAVILVLGPCRQAPLHSPKPVSSLQDLLPLLGLQVQNLSLVERVAREELRDRELKVARKIQERFLPKENPIRPGMEILGKTLPGREVGGDYLDFVELTGGRLGLALGDATGMGIPAALLMAGVAQSFRAMATADRPVSEVLESMNLDMVRSRHDPQFQGFFAAFFYGLLDPSSGLLTFCNAGMPTPWLLRKQGGIERLHRGGPLLGIQENGQFQEGRVLLRPGDLLFIRSDGLEEQEDEQGELFGEVRLLDWMNSKRNRPIEQLGKELIAGIEAFAGKASRDDISMILLRLNPTQ